MSAAFDTATSIAREVRDGQRRAVDVLEQALDRITRQDPQLGAFCGVFGERARAAACRIDAARLAGAPLGPLAGVPIASKDNLLVHGELATAGSRMLERFVAPFTATSLARLEQRDAVLLGRTNMDEFGMGSTTETSCHGRTHNPFGRDLVPGGSSGGSAAAVAAGLCPLAIGSDTGGSVRQPAALCGVTGLKPTYGRVSRFGLIAYASSLDCVGAIARTAEDLALWLDAAGGADPADATSRGDLPPVLPALAQRQDLAGLRLGVPRELHGDGIDAEVLAATQKAMDHLRDLGATLVDCSLPSVQHAVPTYYLIATTEAASNLARYDGVHYGHRADGERSCAGMTTKSRSEGFGGEVQLRVLLGTFASSYGYTARFYERARATREALRRDFANAFAGCDAMLCPTTPTPAFRFSLHDDDPLARFMQDALTVPASLAGVPALSLPCGAAADGRPIGMQLMAPVGRDDLVLQIAHVFQQHSEHHLRTPPRAEAVR